MKATDFNLSTDLTFNPEAGITSFRGNRLVILEADAVGLLRHRLIEEFGTARARDLFLSFGYQNGYADFLQMSVNYQFSTEEELLASGPVIHSWEGIVNATPKQMRFDRTTGEFYFTGVWANSYEAQEHLSFSEPSSEPVCWSLMGYASGWSTAFFGSPLIAIEPVCMGKGDDRCEWLIQPPAAWGDEAQVYLATYRRFFDQLQRG